MVKWKENKIDENWNCSLIGSQKSINLRLKQGSQDEAAGIK